MLMDFASHLLSREALPIVIGLISGFAALAAGIFGMKSAIEHKKAAEGISNLTVQLLDGTQFKIDFSDKELSIEDKIKLLDALSATSQVNLKIGELVLEPPKLEGGSLDVAYSEGEISQASSKDGEKHE